MVVMRVVVDVDGRVKKVDDERDVVVVGGLTYLRTPLLFFVKKHLKH